MFESWKYPHVPIKRGKVLLYKLPDEYYLMNISTVDDTHVVHESDRTDEFRGRNSLALCGQVVNTEIHRRQKINRMCDTCLQNLEEVMQGAMYDEKNERLYLPMEA